MPADKISYVPALLDLELYGGDGAVVNLQLTAPDGTPLELTGQLDAQVRRRRADVDPTETWTVVIADPDNGAAALTLTGDQTSALTQLGKRTFKGVWDLQWTPNGAQPVTLMQGKLTCVPDVTRL